MNRFATQVISKTEAGAYTHTGDTTMTTLRTYTVGGGFSGKRLCTLTFNLGCGGGGGGRVLLNSTIMGMTNLDNGGTIITSEYCVTSVTNMITMSIPISNADTIIIQGIVQSAGSTISLTNVNIWCADSTVTFTGS